MSPISAYWRLARMDRPIGIWLLLWPTLWALWLAADGAPPLSVLVVFVIGTVLMRAAGCAINDVADRNFDPQVARTRRRPIAAGELGVGQAISFAALLALVALGLVIALGRPLVVALSVPAVVVSVVYPFTKRFLSMPQAVLGIAFSWGIPMAYAAVGDTLPWGEMLMLMGANLCWVVAYDTWYAMVDREDDLKAGVRSSAILFGRHDRLAIGVLQGVALSLLIALGLRHGLGLAWEAGLAVAAWLAAWQQWITRGRDGEACFAAFLNNHYFGGAIFVGLAIDRLLSH